LGAKKSYFYEFRSFSTQETSLEHIRLRSNNHKSYQENAASLSVKRILFNQFLHSLCSKSNK